MAHLLYGLKFEEEGFVLDRDSVFIPVGWDNEKKIGILNDSLGDIRPTDAFHDVITVPPPLIRVSAASCLPSLTAFNPAHAEIFPRLFRTPERKPPPFYRTEFLRATHLVKTENMQSSIFHVELWIIHTLRMFYCFIKSLE